MNAEKLRTARFAGGWTQAEAASRLGVSQPYYSQLEKGYRPMPAELALAAVRLLGLSPVALPLPSLDPHLTPLDPGELAAQLASLGYSGFSHLQQASKSVNPAYLVAAALAHAELDVRLVEALPWVLSSFHELDWEWLSGQCRLGNRQNRLGYLVLLATQLTKPGAGASLTAALVELERSRLAGEGTLCHDSMSAAERKWVRQHRPTDAAHWNLLTTLAVDQLSHVA